MKKILVIRSSTNLQFVEFPLRDVEGYEVFLAASREKGMKMVKKKDHDLIVLDIGGHLSLLEEIRKVSQAPVLVIGVKNDEVYTLNAGTDDFVPRPFGNDEVLARVRALLRRGR